MEGLKTKEEYLCKFGCIDSVGEVHCHPDEFYLPMNQYAEQQSIAFAEWINGEMYECFLHSDENVKFWHDWEGNGNYTTEDLYKIFISTL